MSDISKEQRFATARDRIMNLFWIEAIELNETPKLAYDVLNLLTRVRKNPELFNKASYEGRRQWDMFPYLQDLEYEEIEEFCTYFKETVRRIISTGCFPFNASFLALNDDELKKFKRLANHV